MRRLFLAMLMLLTGLPAHATSASATAPAVTAVNAPTQFVEANGRKIAYRSIGTGTPLILAVRFRGIIDSWDPAFIDALAKNFRVIVFDYSGLGRSTGTRATTTAQMVGDIRDLADGLKLRTFVLGGWSLGGAIAQEAAVTMPERITHLVIIGSAPPGLGFGKPQQIFLDTAFKPVNDLADEEILFFLPSNPASKAAAAVSRDRIAARTQDLSIPVPPAFFADEFKVAADFRADDSGVTQFLFTTKMPILIVAGDHDVSCPVQDWDYLSGRFSTARIFVLPQSGHAPQHQYPEEVATHITTFVAS